MTKEECAIVTLYTGVAMLEGDDLEYLYKYAEKLMERPVLTHEIAMMTEELKKRAAPDFINLCRWASAQPEPKTGKWIKQNPLVDTEECSECGYNILSEELETPFCPWCGSPMMRQKGGRDE